GAKGTPAVVMALIFAGAPMVNAAIDMTRSGTWGQVRWPFVLGIALAAVGGGLVTLYKPTKPHAPAPEVPAEHP
ncbi:MAG: hypothetical protein KC656_34090, partial [Myxococcales bacterium]|nr:hypothetical protein [Myxococcales bacterium]